MDRVKRVAEYHGAPAQAIARRPGATTSCVAPRSVSLPRGQAQGLQGRDTSRKSVAPQGRHDPAVHPSAKDEGEGRWTEKRVASGRAQGSLA